MNRIWYLLPLIILLIAVPVVVAQDMGPGYPGGPGFPGGPRFPGGPGFPGGGFPGGRMGRMGMGGMGMGGMGGMRGMGMNGMGGMGMNGMGMNNMGMGGMGMGGMGMQGMSPEAMQQARAQRMQAMLQNIDLNRNGQIDPEEAQGPNAFMLDRILRNAGIEPKYPMPVSKVQEALNNRFRSAMGQPAQSADNSGSSSSSDKSSEESKSSTPRLVPGFDVAMASLPPCPASACRFLLPPTLQQRPALQAILQPLHHPLRRLRLHLLPKKSTTASAIMPKPC